MTRQQEFQLHVHLSALKRDLEKGTSEHQLIFAFAEEIPAENIPINAENAAKVLVSFLTGNRRATPLKWMFPKRTVGLPRERGGRNPKPSNVINL